MAETAFQAPHQCQMVVSIRVIPFPPQLHEGLVLEKELFLREKVPDGTFHQVITRGTSSPAQIDAHMHQVRDGACLRGLVTTLCLEPAIVGHQRNPERELSLRPIQKLLLPGERSQMGDPDQSMPVGVRVPAIVA